MKVLRYIFLLFMIASSSYANDDIFSTKHFSIIIPEGMTIDEKSDDKIALVFKGDDDLKNGTLAVISKESEHILDLNMEWSKIRSFTVAGEKVLYEKEETFAGLKWKVIAVTGETWQCEIKGLLYYSIKNNVQYMIHYYCHPENCTTIKGAFDNIINSFKISRDVK